MRPRLSSALAIALGAIGTAVAALCSWGVAVATAGPYPTQPMYTRGHYVTTSGSSTTAVVISVAIIAAIVAGSVVFAVLTLRRERPTPTARVAPLPTEPKRERTPKAA